MRIADKLLSRQGHRPWPCPRSQWTWRQSWNELLFLHYRVEKKEISHLVPDGVHVQEFDGTSWIGIVPFRMQSVMRNPLPDFPWFSNFLELNVRLYVEYEGKAGVWFLSLDATNPFVVWGGQRYFKLPYHNARMRLTEENEFKIFQSTRKDKTQANFRARYRPTSDVFYSQAGTLEHFLTERYCFFSQVGDRVVRTDVHHWPWPLRIAKVEVLSNTLVNEWAITLREPAFCHYSPGVDVISWPPGSD